MSYPLATDVHQVLDQEGRLVADPPPLDDDVQRALYRWMVLGRLFSDRMIALQRQGRMGTFAPLRGQEASAAIATALRPDDWLITSYREMIPLFVKGLSLETAFGASGGRFGDGFTPALGVLPIQIVLATQMPHAAGVAMAMKYEGKDSVAVGVCGDGATSEGDFNEALNFAAVFQAPLVAVVQNNGWAISVPRSRQTAGEYIAHRGPAFGMPGYLVDGNDVLAVHQVMADCVARARAGDGPSLVELLTYRMGAHTTADDPSRYQPEEELARWQKRDPLTRYRAYLLRSGLLDDAADEQLHDQLQAEIQAAVEAYEALPPTDPQRLFDLVYQAPTPQLEAQRAAFLEERDDA